jgi:hypothetical protein
LGYSSKGTQTTCLLAVGKFRNTVSGLMQWALLTVQTWRNEVELSVNPEKTGLAAFTRKRKLPGFFEPQFFGVKSLGVGQVSRRYPGFSVDLERMWLSGRGRQTICCGPLGGRAGRGA